MSTVTPTVIPKPPWFPHCLPEAPKPHPKPLPPRQGLAEYGRLNAVRDLNKEMDDLSDEEGEIDEINNAIHRRGYSFIVPIGKMLTQQEEKNDAEEEETEEESEEDEDEDEDEEDESNAPSLADNDDEEADLDASMDDLDDDEDAEGDMDDSEA